MIDGSADGASCTASFCSFRVDFSPELDGPYLLAIYDVGGNASGSYEISVSCLSGTCASSPEPAMLVFGTSVREGVSATEIDQYVFEASAGALAQHSHLRRPLKHRGNCGTSDWP